SGKPGAVHIVAYHGSVGTSFVLVLFRYLGHEEFEFRILAVFGASLRNCRLTGAFRPESLDANVRHHLACLRRKTRC
ncbi:MAG: hypothetical protein KDH19_20095, partial [Geminicoccaceae bacterium]|nr:hypothetical protein [Geminicoccaceae bacterium]